MITRSRVIDEDGRTREVKSFDYRNMRSMGLEINDLIAPTSFDIAPEHIQMGNKFSRTLRVTNLPSQLNDEFINSATDMSFNCLTTMNYKAIPTREALQAKDDPAHSFMVHDVVLMVLYNKSDERTLQEFTKAMTDGDEKLLESVLHSRDPFGKYRNMVLDTFGDSVSKL